MSKEKGIEADWSALQTNDRIFSGKKTGYGHPSLKDYREKVKKGLQNLIDNPNVESKIIKAISIQRTAIGS